MKHSVEQVIFNGPVTTGAASTPSLDFEVPQGMFFEKIGLFCTYTPGTPGNTFALSALWTSPDLDYSLASYLNPTISGVTASCVITVCNPGGARRLSLGITSAGTGIDALVIAACAIVEP